MKQTVLALNLHSGGIKDREDINEPWDNKTFQLDLPEGCLGFCLVFESKKAAQAYWGNRVQLIDINLPRR